MGRFESNHPEVLRRVTKAVIKSLYESGAIVKTTAKLLCPVRTGNLRRSINDEVKASGLSVEIGTPVDYAPHVEYGTVRSRAKPYLRPAGDGNRGKVELIFQKNLRMAMK